MQGTHHRHEPWQGCTSATVNHSERGVKLHSNSLCCHNSSFPLQLALLSPLDTLFWKAQAKARCFPWDEVNTANSLRVIQNKRGAKWNTSPAQKVTVITSYMTAYTSFTIQKLWQAHIYFVPRGHGHYLCQCFAKHVAQSFEKHTWGPSTSHADPVIQLIIKHKREVNDCSSTYIAKWNQSQALEQQQNFPSTGENKASSFVISPRSFQ